MVNISIQVIPSESDAMGREETDGEIMWREIGRAHV
jgi:hypothetical protein